MQCCNEACLAIHLIHHPHEADGVSKVWVTSRHEAGWGTLDSGQQTIRSGIQVFNSSHSINTKFRIPPLSKDWTDRTRFNGGLFSGVPDGTNTVFSAPRNRTLPKHSGADSNKTSCQDQLFNCPASPSTTATTRVCTKQQLAGLCQAELREIHSEIPGLNPIEETQVQGVWVSTATLEADEKRQQPTGISTPDRGTVLVDPTEFNNAYSEKASRSEADWKPSVFISYSKDDVSLRERLERELKILMNEGLLASHWHDRMIDPGDKWDDTIQSQLAEADVVILLVSTAALATDYITKHEIPQALALSKSGKTVLVPVILESCRWAKTALGALNALPDKATPLNKWDPLADGWKCIADGLAKVFEKLIQQGGRLDRPR